MFAEGLILHSNTTNSHVWTKSATFTLEGTFLVVGTSEIGSGRKFFGYGVIKFTTNTTKCLINITKDGLGHTEHFDGEHDW